MEYIGTARNVRELLALIKKVDLSSTITLRGNDESWSHVEAWYDEETNDLVLM